MTIIKPEPADISDLDDHVGVILTGLRAIGRYMGVSPMTIRRWREKFRGSTDPRLCFPLLWLPTGKGWGFVYKAHTGMIANWIQRWSILDAKERELRPKQPRPRRKKLQ